ncbi:mandelate racemase/muconate lactonizing enzyme family protein [Halalkalibacter alkaliphilus]|uniref:Mandelate racemase/muconate lactonizing enzyme family protein n=1 Tax=Halalkalibacter alkaliphilus TaxID=2917993 RepID=A0A9X2A2Y9_9BACI|nr:mandelate racemase/muconate lactonizing enzyme family protein [Halalkalibacter alkaliphilus]MCL7745772.1 mandelate racemase/muconate lactonizing enzyme family protein [Halalkalibacter alkaliphilus]
MNITKLETIKLQFSPKNPPRDGLSSIKNRDVFLIRIHTDQGISGIGEAFALGSAHSLQQIIDEILSPLLIGEDPTSIEYLWDKMYKLTFRVGRRGIVLAAMSAIDIALWDLMGKLTNMPVYKLLGGYTNKVNAYASGGYYLKGKTVADLVTEAINYKKMGFKAMKMKIGGASLSEDIERISAVKDILGKDVRLAIDANNSYNINEALRLCKQIEDLDIMFFEEPISSDFIDNSSYLVNMTSIPIAGYETDYTRYSFKNIIDKQAVNIVQTDVIWAGGISECKKIATLAATSGLKVIPHFSAGAVSLAANLHFSLSLSNCDWFEYTLDENPLRDELSLTPHSLKEGVLYVNDLPGLGIELNEDIVNKYRI